MATNPDIHNFLQQHGAEMITFGDPRSPDAVDLPAGFGEYPGEYAAIRKGVGIMVAPHRSALRLRGNDRNDFLQRLITQDIRSLKPGNLIRSFLLSEKGRIRADLLLADQGDSTLMILDRCDAASLAGELERFIFTEDVTVENQTEQFLVISLLGPEAWHLLDSLGDAGNSEPLPYTVTTIYLPQSVLTCWRFDQTGTSNLHILAPTSDAASLVDLLAKPLGGLVPDISPDIEKPVPDISALRRPVVGRGVGWLAFNTARIESGTPLFHVDFGPNSLPHETALLGSAVSFTKGCYRGQEIVARMENLGHPARKLVRLTFPSDALPIAGSQVFASPDDQTVVGAVTSSTLSPLRGQAAVGLAMMKWGLHEPGKKVFVHADGTWVEARVEALQPS
ncbi:MAG: aminomethyltransferase family protein [Phycisphaeraceae bacterium]|nr:aminomethyltransferase family protein [Phycisphaeraceae bacterium]